MIDLDHLAAYAKECRDEECDYANLNVDDLEEIITCLREAEADAKRYRWLRDECKHGDWHAIGASDPSEWNAIVDGCMDEGASHEAS